VDELVPVGTMASIESRMEARKSGVGEVRLDELAVRRWRWSTRVPASLGPPSALAVDGVGVGRRGRRGGAGVLPVGLALTLDRVGFLWEGFVAANLVV